MCLGNVLHVIDIETEFQNEGLVHNMNAIGAWKFLCEHWVDVYAEAPEYIKTDFGTNFKSQTF